MNVCFLVQDVGAVYGAERATVDLAAGLRAVPETVEVRVLMIDETRRPRERSRYCEVLAERVRTSLNSLRNQLAMDRSRR